MAALHGCCWGAAVVLMVSYFSACKRAHDDRSPRVDTWIFSSAKCCMAGVVEGGQRVVLGVDDDAEAGFLPVWPRRNGVLFDSYVSNPAAC